MAEAPIAEQIDKLAKQRNWFRPDDDGPFYDLIKSYMAGSTPLAETVQRIVQPINAAYSSADSGQAIRGSEQAAANQRQFHSAEEAEEIWGKPLPESELPPELDGAPSTEGQLWELWYTVLHTAKKTSWTNTNGQESLLDLIRELKQQPDPEPPKPMTKALKHDWTYSSGTLWSTLAMLGPSVRETWNDSPSAGAGYELPEIWAWTNVNAFVARLTKTRTAHFWVYAAWALRAAFEDDLQRGRHDKAAGQATQLDAFVPAAAVWVLILGKELYDREDEPGVGAEFSKGRWSLWKERLDTRRNEDGIRPETKEIADEAFAKMEEVERA